MKPAAAIVCAVSIIVQPLPAFGADAAEVFGLTLNGRVTGLVGEFQRCDGQPCATAADMTALGFVVPDDLAKAHTLIPLSALPGVRVRIAAAEQVIYVEADNAALLTTVIRGDAQAPLAPLSPTSFGAVLDYDILANRSNAGTSVAGLLDLHLFGPFGSFDTVANVTAVAISGHSGVVHRLGTTYTFTDPDKLFRLRVGDVVTGALSWNRAIRLGGIQFSRDFNLRPDLVTYPLPSFAASTVVPATVNLIANGVQQSSTAIQPGPFAVHMLPVITGAGDVSLAIQDTLGRQTVLTVPIYVSSALLRPGLTNFSLAAGLVRDGYGTNTDHYAGWAGNASVQHGLTDWLTIEAHGEASDGLGQIGLGATIRIGALGIANVALSGSVGNRLVTAGRRSGELAVIGFQRISRRINFSANATFETVGYRDIAAVRGFALPKSTVNISAGYRTNNWGLFGISYIAQNQYGIAPNMPDAGLPLPIGNSQYRIINASYNVYIRKLGSFRLGAYRDISRHGGYGFSGGLSVFFGKSGISAALDGSYDGGQSSSSASLGKTAIAPGDLGYTIRATEGGISRHSAEFDHYGQWGHVTAGIEQSSAGVLGQVGVRGALSLIGGSVFASNHIDDSFALVRTGHIGNIPIQYENRPIGKTNADGLLIVPALMSYQNNRLSLDPSRLPPDIVVGQAFTIVRPRDGSGVIVDFAVTKVHAAVIVLHDSTGKPIPIGSLVTVDGAPDQTVGYDGEAYLNDLKPENRIKITRPDGSRCLAEVTYKPVPGDIPTIGPVPCL
ncbi:fimbria/pilus outer membrane usher protein [Novosphingobium sp.]|uniref:fimbria/pilus outer membrane usher protein n=1 Tax=Novosphingobium sp. TaxID=1874826 RepID=UPI00334111A9